MPCCSFRSSWKNTQSVALLRHNRTCKGGDGLEATNPCPSSEQSYRTPVHTSSHTRGSRHEQGYRGKDVLRRVGGSNQVSRPGTSMGRKRWWRGGLELLVLFIFHHIILGDGDVGCLFSKSLCDPRTETCYNDLAFGKCLPLYTDLNDEDYYQYNFNVDELELLRLRLERLQIDGYKWSHPYTQCIMQTSLYNLRHEENYDLRLCQHLKQRVRFENKNEIDQARVPSIAIVKFTPNSGVSNGQFANELYYPPGTRNQYLTDSSKEQIAETNSDLYRPRYKPNSYNEYDTLTNDESYDESNSRKAPLSFNEVDERLYRTRRQPYNLRDYDDDAIESIKNALEEEEEEGEEGKDLSKELSENRNSNPIDNLTADNLEFLAIDQPDDYSDDEKRKTGENFVMQYAKAFSRKYKPRKFIELPDKDVIFLENVKRNSDNYDNDDYDDVNDEEELPQRDDSSSMENGIYTEGGLLQAADDKSDVDDNENTFDTSFEEGLNELIWGRGLAGFKRRERLDVKKPGPPFSTNNYAFKTPSPSALENENRSDSVEIEQDNDVLLNPYVKKEVGSGLHVDDTKLYNNVDLDHVYVEFQQAFHTWSEGEHVVKQVAKLLGLTPGSLKDIRVGRAEVTFKVVKNNKNYNATDVVDNIDNIRSKLKETLGVEVTRAGIGDKVHLETCLKHISPTNTVQNYLQDHFAYKNIAMFTINTRFTEPNMYIRNTADKSLRLQDNANHSFMTKLPAMLEVAKKTEMSSSMFGAIVAAGVVAAGTAAVIILIVARRHAKARAKLAGLATPDPEVSKDYQDLCRARMHAKQPTDKPESPRITSLSRESESNNLPSNRSSTSSWGEEPTLSNMDISTGKMVLSYMEDHLMNKDRLDQEWTALCAYEVDPSSTEIAQSEANSKCNRPNAAFPYDHSRMILNDLANANNSDYINASTITDHDPRNPAYIATQGPLPQTTADFWQLVWEQGSVVIVMLTRLTEEGVAMCHRYWPEEGSELYHIYEVHLVSEHFWCDDYLVRSFYLKNLRTGETRTVTQFHFLSWPENSVPHSTKALLEFRRKINKSYKGRSCPIVVHCSDGAGRTGTYCLIDMVLNRMMKGAKEIDIAATLEHIRDQRPNMVATKQQFKFVLMAVAEEVHAILKALPAPPAEKSVPGNNSSTKEGQ